MSKSITIGQKEYTFEEIEVILTQCRKQLIALTEIYRINPTTITIYVPEYFTGILSEYFRLTQNGAALASMCFSGHDTPNGSFYGVKHFYPSPTNEIIVSFLRNPLFTTSLDFKINLK